MEGIFYVYPVDYINGVVQIIRKDKEDLENPMFARMFDDLDTLSDDKRRKKILWLESMVGRDEEIVINVPGKIQFTNDSKAVINGTKVTFVENNLEILMSKKSQDRLIKYTPN